MLAVLIALVGQIDPVPVDFDSLVDDSLGSTDWIQAGIVVVVAILVPWRR